ncbi:TetR/AcrR family transcriptional regulator [Heyndrickxia vini]|uniref:TetR/AcrR family transcriptional regulator n=1 Tax=Heyndrickxia vini TaxID=1476025 RepID=A0ABX7E4N0_9BACI|nr:TetR/AcrR family transcriptional regulator [Heyndrickxia vini]QQZ09322.1 TetR/AcrR family transcriptional regulator [Heyndrickxia vini]
MQKKQLIMEKALELFAEQGFESTSVQQITERCGISKGAFYLSFKSKDELILSIIDHFMMQITADIDHIVKNSVTNDKLLYKFYYAIFHAFHQKSDFAKVMMNEQSNYSLNKELISKLRYYDQILDQTILFMIERLYGKNVAAIKYDLMYCIRGFMGTYSHLFFFYNFPIDLEALSKSLEEKTNLLAKHTTIPFISEELAELCNNAIPEGLTKEKMIKKIDKKIKEIEESIEMESLILLKEHIVKPVYSPAIVKGLLENIRNHPQCKWLTYLLFQYFGI